MLLICAHVVIKQRRAKINMRCNPTCGKKNILIFLEKLKIIFILFYKHIINEFTIIKSKFELKSIKLLNFLNAI